jgi:hypothetical protein
MNVIYYVTKDVGSNVIVEKITEGRKVKIETLMKVQLFELLMNLHDISCNEGNWGETENGSPIIIDFR